MQENEKQQETPIIRQKQPLGESPQNIQPNNQKVSETILTKRAHRDRDDQGSSQDSIKEKENVGIPGPETKINDVI